MQHRCHQTRSVFGGWKEVSIVDWDQWQTLLAIFRSGTYSRAAGSLGVDATTVGRRLKLLEKHLGYELFLRENGRLYPTRRCESLLSHVEAAAEALRDAEQESAAVESGTVWRELRMTAPPFLITHLFAPAIATLVRKHRIRAELMGTASKVSLTRREADIAIRIEDRPQELKVESERIDAERIGTLTYAIYCHPERDPETLPWAGLMEQYVRTTGSEIMMELASPDGFQYQAYHFEPLKEIVASGVARAMLPRFIADSDRRLCRIGDTVLQQPLWMLYHWQDREIHHLEAARSWVRMIADDTL